MQRSVMAGAVGGYFVDATAILLPIFLLPRLYSSIWSELSIKERRLTDALASSLFMFGNTCGLILGGVFGDRFGRRVIMLIGVALTAVATAISLAVPPSVTSFLTWRVVAGFGAGGALNSGFLLAVEWAPYTHRILCKTCTSGLGWVPGIVFLCAISLATRHAARPWQALAWCLTPAPFVWAYMYLRCHESPRFLLSIGDPRAALRLLRRGAHVNGTPLPASVALALPGGGSCTLPADDIGGEKGGAVVSAAFALPNSTADAANSVDGCLHGGAAVGCECGAAACSGGAGDLREGALPSCGPDSLFHRSMRKRTLLVGIAWFGTTCVYYGVMLAPINLGNASLEMRTAMGALVELPAYCLMSPLGDRFGRRYTWAGFLSTAGGSLLLLGLLGGGHAAPSLSHHLAHNLRPSHPGPTPHHAAIHGGHQQQLYGVHHAAHYHAHHYYPVGGQHSRRRANTRLADSGASDGSDGSDGGDDGNGGDGNSGDGNAGDGHDGDGNGSATRGVVKLEEPPNSTAAPTVGDEDGAAGGDAGSDAGSDAGGDAGSDAVGEMGGQSGGGVAVDVASHSAAHKRASIAFVLALIARCGAAGSSALCYVAAAEQFPTACRNSGVGFGSACGRFASILAPIAVNLLPSPFFLLAALAVCATLAALALPETAGRPITESDESGGTNKEC